MTAPRSLSDRERVLSTMAAVDNDFGYLSFRHISERSGVPLAEARAIVRGLASEGLAEFARGLFTEDGEPYGSGYALTVSGLEIAGAIEPAAPVGFGVPLLSETPDA